MNYKNLLQEYYQKKGPNHPFPTYNLIEDQLLSDNSHIFITELTLPDKEDEKYIGKGTTKKESQQDAAQKAYLSLQGHPIDPNHPPSIPIAPTLEDYQPPDMAKIKRIVLIDIENMPQALPPQHQYPANTYIVGFTSVYSSHYKKRDQIKPYCDLRLIDSAVKDSADVALIYECGRLVESFKDSGINPNIIIITSDHYAEPLLKLIQESLPEKEHLKITCSSNLDQI